MPKKVGYARLHKNVTKIGFRKRSFTQKCNRGRSRLRSVTQKSKKAGSWLRTVTQKKRCRTHRFHGYASNRVTGYVDPWLNYLIILLFIFLLITEIAALYKNF